MNYDTEYPTKKAKIDRIKELEKELTMMTKHRDDTVVERDKFESYNGAWATKYVEIVSNNDALQFKVDTMQSVIDVLNEDYDILSGQFDSRDRRIDELKEECYRVEKLANMEIDALRSAADALADKVKKQAEHIDQLLKVNVGLVEQNRELDKLEIDEPVDFMPTVEENHAELGVHILPAGNYIIELVDGRMKIIGVAK